jgi:hypothetical protein
MPFPESDKRGEGPSRRPYKRSMFEDYARRSGRETPNDQPLARATGEMRRRKKPHAVGTLTNPSANSRASIGQ